MLASQKFWLVWVTVGTIVCATSAATVSSEEVTEASTDATTAKYGPCEPLEPTALQIPFRTCYVEASKVLALMVRMSAVLGMLNNDEDYLDSKVQELKKWPDLQKYEMCSEQRIEQLTEELRWVSRRLWELSIRLEEPKDAEVQLLDKRKVDLIRHLRNIRVFTGESPTLTSSLHLESFDVEVEYLEYGFNTALVMFQTDRPARPVPVAPKAAMIRSILNPENSVSDLIELSRDQPTAMTDALPQLISDLYAGKRENVQVVLDIIKQLPYVVHQMIGYTSLYDAMSDNSDLESYQLTEFVLQLKGINATVTSAAADIPRSVLTRYKQLVVDVWPTYQIIGRNTTCEFRNMKYERSVYGWNSINSLYSAESSRHYWNVYMVSDTSMFTIETSSNHIYSSASDVFSASKRSVKYRSPPVSELFSQWKLVPVKGGKYYRILNAKYDEVLFADKTEMNPGTADSRRLFLARHDYPHLHDYEHNADLWIVNCK